MRATNALAAALLTASLALAGCGASDTISSQADKKAVQPAERRADGAAAAGPGGAETRPQEKNGAPPKQPVLTGAQVIRTAELSVRVGNTQRALATARAAAEDSGGRVESETTERVEDGRVMSHMVVRVPQSDYDAVLKRLAGTGTLIERRATAKDVTDQVVDVDSRIATQRASVVRVRELMERATTISDVVELEGQLSMRQAALESLLAQQSALRDRVALATITLSLTETGEAEPSSGDTGFLDALGGGWDAFVATLRWIVVVLAAVAPFLAALAGLYLLWRLVRALLPGRRGSSGPDGGPAAIPTQPAPAGAAPSAAPRGDSPAASPGTPGPSSGDTSVTTRARRRRAKAPANSIDAMPPRTVPEQ